MKKDITSSLLTYAFMQVSASNTVHRIVES
jgi:hypothetical protein